MERKNVVLEKSIAFALEVIRFTEMLQDQKKFVIANQMLKSGTSIGAMIHEAQNAESKADFIHKLKIAAKELEETRYWILLCERSEYYENPKQLKEQVNELGLILYKILSTSYKTKP
ncbi:CHP02436-containing protein [Formosa agariphila KMM 3901]|uniref:CHP02436-containing protein n=1 Tax=Formosa agariphila (strain DSM 15362 / KCTC 12365 / LMG 23005 / KMM 3901 / M-2Alg 35-1) TaxID=1347342 RepID=T2KQN3_FORAG|nr:four helix bundle protein [Formosa agariphila]CDF81152.1 CHP02436-containing protein [Formosa agariphila KMM 3901]